MLKFMYFEKREQKVGQSIHFVVFWVRYCPKFCSSITCFSFQICEVLSVFVVVNFVNLVELRTT